MMKVYELIEMLKHFNPEAIVHIEPVELECPECGMDLWEGHTRANKVYAIPQQNTVRIGG